MNSSSDAANQLLAHLRSLGVRAKIENGQLAVSGPKGVLTPDLREQIAARKPQLLHLLELEEANHAESRTIPALTRPGKFAASFAQQRLWFLDRLDPGLPVYNIPAIYRLTGELNIRALEQSLQEIVRRHESLRTNLVAGEEGPWQIIEDRSKLDVPLIDLRHLLPEEREEAARKLAEEEVAKSFDLEHDLKLRAKLICVDETTHILVITIHHVASDGWSTAIFWKELTALYAAYGAGEPSPLSPPTIQYADFAVWQRNWLRGKVLEQELEYWRAQLADLQSLNLPADFSRPAINTYQGKTEQFEVPVALAAQLNALARQEGATLYMLLLAAFNILLYRYTGQEDIAVGSPIANRTRTELEELIGFFVNMLVVRTSLAGQPTFRELLRHVRKVALDAYVHQDLPFEKLVEELQPERDLGRHPLFQVSFTLQNTPQSPSDLTGLTVERIKSAERGTSKFDLSLTITFRDGALGGSLAYRTDLFKAKTIQRMIGHYQRLLEAIVECPDCTIGHLPMLSESELRQLLVEWNHTSAPYPRESTIDAVFETQARNTPDAEAIYFEGQTLTYAELDQRANQVAHFLIERGVKPGEIVGLACERSPELIIAMLAILKAGAAYLPLDKEHPHERLNRMLEEAQCRYIVTHKELHLPVSSATRLFNLDNAEVSGAIERQSNENVQRPASSSSLQLAYVMFTSGSSGQPKGVMVPHRAVVRLVKNASFAVLDSAQRFLQFAPVSFDASTFEIWGPLLNGGQLFIYPPESASLSRLARYVRENRITTLWLTAGLFQQMVEHEPDSLAGIDHVLTGGDVVSAQHARQLMQAGGRCRLSNAYGPTENTTFTTCFTMTTAAGIGDTLPIGRPISNTTVYLLDANLQPVPIGLPGELYTGGDGVALGYLNRPELTQEAFIPDPFSGREGDHLYRTGDLARYTADGNIEFLGRMDDQVKIRGFRVEPGEIEHVLLQHPVVREAAVLAHEEEPGDKRLTAYLVLEDHYSSAVVDELHSLCSKKLPAYMVPAAFAVVEKMPLTINGKIDRAALLALDTAVYPERPMYVSPRTPEEAAVAAIWQELLRIDPVGVFDNFFELGGHSLLATQVVARISRIYQVELTLHLLFEKPTVAAIAAEVLELVARRDDHRRKMEEALTRIKELTPAERADLLSSLEQTTVEEAKNDG